jgi:protein O-mannosyl-transferase
MRASAPLVRQSDQRDRGENASRRPLSFRRIITAHWFRCVVLAAAGIIIHSPALQGQRIWDDQYLIHQNPFIKSPLLIPESFRHYLFADSYSPHYRPVQNISYCVDYWLWNENEFGFHLTNVLLHVACAILLYFLLRQLLIAFRLPHVVDAVRQRKLAEMPWISTVAWIVALVWLVHPVHSAAVDYISGRADSLAFGFSAAAWLLLIYLRRVARLGLRVAGYILAAVFGLAALCSREIAIIWMVLFVLHGFFFEKATPRKTRIYLTIGCVILISSYASLRSLPGFRQSFEALPGSSTPVRAVLMARALGDYSRLLLWPSRLYMERTVFLPTHYENLQTWRRTIGTEYLSALGLSTLAFFIVSLFKRDRWRATRMFGAAWFLLAYLPISNIFQLNATVAEHWLYLPSVGFLIFIAGWIWLLPPRFRGSVTAAIILVVLSLGVRSFVRSSDWKDEETLYKSAFEAGSRSARIACNLAQVYAAQGKYAEAERIFRSVLEQNPDYPIAQNNLASVLAREGKNSEAEALFALIEKNSAKTREEYSRTWIGALNLAYVRHNAHNDDAALSILEHAHNDYPEVWELVRLKAEIIREHIGPEAALRLVQDFARENWWHQGAAIALGRLYTQSGDIDRADAALQLAARLDVHGTEALKLLAEMRVRQNRFEEAYLLQRRAVAREPDQPSQYLLLSDILERMGRCDEARAALAQASHLQDLVKNSQTQSL